MFLDKRIGVGFFDGRIAMRNFWNSVPAVVRGFIIVIARWVGVALAAFFIFLLVAKAMQLSWRYTMGFEPQAQQQTTSTGGQSSGVQIQPSIQSPPPALPVTSTPLPPAPLPPPPDNSAEILQRELQSFSKESRLAALDWAATRAGSPNVAYVVAYAMVDLDQDVSNKAQQVLLAMGPTASTDPLVSLLDSPDEKIRLKAMECLGQIGAPAVAPMLRKMGASNDFYRREEIKMMLVAMGKDITIVCHEVEKEKRAAESRRDAGVSLAATQVLIGISQ